MKKTILFFGIGLLLSGCMNTQNQNQDSLNEQMEPELEAPVTTTNEQNKNEPWGNIYPIYHIPVTNEQFDDIRYSCGNNRIIAGNTDEFGGTDSLTIMPANQELKKIDPAARFVSYTFGYECENVYAIVEYAEKKSDILHFDAQSGKYEKLTENLVPSFETTEELMDAAPDTPLFLYAIRDEALLVSFMPLTTGMDAYTNLTIHKIFDLETRTFSESIFSSLQDSEDQYLAPPTLLDFKRNILSSVIASDKAANENYAKLRREDFDLSRQENTKTTELDPKILENKDKLLFTCPELPEKSACIKQDLQALFPESNESREAENTLIRFFTFLSEEQFEEASALYSSDESDWEELIIYTTEGEKNDKAKILENYCSATQTCLRAEVLKITTESEGEYSLLVQFRNTDESVFVADPCCGATAEEMPSQSRFEYTVQKVGSRFEVATPPVYRP